VIEQLPRRKADFSPGGGSVVHPPTDKACFPSIA
jgi:hypothetical protein